MFHLLYSRFIGVFSKKKKKKKEKLLLTRLIGVKKISAPYMSLFLLFYRARIPFKVACITMQISDSKKMKKLLNL